MCHNGSIYNYMFRFLIFLGKACYYSRIDMFNCRTVFTKHLLPVSLRSSSIQIICTTQHTVSLQKYLCLGKFHSDLQRAEECLSLLFSRLSFSGTFGTLPWSLKALVVLSSTAVAAWKHLRAPLTPLVRNVRGKKGRSHFSSIYSTIRGYSKN